MRGYGNRGFHGIPPCGKHAACAPSTGAKRAVWALAGVACAAVLAVCVAVGSAALPTYAWLSSSGEVRSAEFGVPYCKPTISVQKAGVSISVDESADDGTFSFTAETDVVYTVSVSATSQSPSYIVVTAAGLSRSYVSGALASSAAGSSTNESSDNATPDESLSFTVCLRERGEVVIAPRWGTFKDLDFADETDESIAFAALPAALTSETENGKADAGEPSSAMPTPAAQADSTDSEEGSSDEVPKSKDTASGAS